MRFEKVIFGAAWLEFFFQMKHDIDRSSAVAIYFNTSKRIPVESVS